MQRVEIFSDKDNRKVLCLQDAQDYITGTSYFILAGVNNQTSINFQYGDGGVNGITSETLLELIVHRTKILNAKEHCDENDTAILLMEEAIKCFNERTQRLSNA